MRVKAVVAEVREEPAGICVLAKSKKIKGVIRISLKGWQGAEKPKIKDEVVVWNLRKSQNGWTALNSQFDVRVEKSPAVARG